MLKVQTWRPDTCGCLLHQAMEDGIGPDGEPNGLEFGSNFHYVTFAEAEAIVAARRASAYFRDKTTDKPQPAMVACAHHVQHGHTAARMDVVTEENRRKNLVFKRILEVIPEFTVTDAQGNTSQRIDEYQWAFDANRNLVYSVGLGTTGQKNQVAALVRGDHGNIKVMQTDRAAVEAVRAI